MSDSIFDKPRFQDPVAARQYLESVRWPNGPICPHCGSVSEDHYTMHGKAQRDGLYKCKDCREQFTVTIGTVFERSKIPLNKWVMLAELMCSSKKGISSKQVERMLGVTYKTAWFMTHRMREAMTPKGGTTGKLGGGSGIIEADETFIGKKKGAKSARGWGHKNAVFSLVEREGNVRSFHVLDVTASTLKPILMAQVDLQSTVYTDDFSAYKKAKLKRDFGDHQTVNHSAKEYVRGNVHTNTIEGYFSIFKRGMYGTYQHVSSHHLHRYTSEFDFRYNHREKLGYSDSERAAVALKGISGKRLTYRRINAPA